MFDPGDRDWARCHVAVLVEPEVAQDSAAHAIGKEVCRDGGAGSVGVGDRVEENLGRLCGDRGATVLEHECLAEFLLEFLAERAVAVGWQAWLGQVNAVGAGAGATA